jgi:ferredoxin-NADP reductase
MYGNQTRLHTPRPSAPPAPHLFRVRPEVALPVIFGGAAAVLALWWFNTASVVGADGWLTAAGRISGLLAGYACAVLILLMARVPALERGVGTDRLARWHAAGGRYTVSLVVAHVVLIIWGYSLTAHAGAVSETGTLLTDYPDMLKATAAVLLLVVTGVVSARAARRRLGYEVWHFLHLTTYLAVFLAFGHQLANGAEFVGNRTAQLLWYALYGGTAAILLWYRVVLPVRRALRHRLRVTEVRPEAPGVVSVYVAGRHLNELRAQPGQFFRWRFLAPGLWWAANPYSLSAAPLPRRLRITVKGVGRHSRELARLQPGTKVLAGGPYGALTAARRRRSKVLLLAGGVGVTPLRALFETLPGEPGDLTLLYFARTPDDLALRDELDAIAQARGARVHYSVDTPSQYRLPLTADALNWAVPDLSGHDVYLCGPPGMADAATAALREAGVPRSHIHRESFEL